MKKRTFNILIFIILISLIFLGSLFWIGKVSLGRYDDPELGGERLSVVLDRISASGGDRPSRDVQILVDNQQRVRSCILSWAKERDKISDSFYLSVMEALKNQDFVRFEKRGAIWYHMLAVGAIELLHLNDKEISEALNDLNGYYKGRGYFIEEDLERVMKRLSQEGDEP